MVMKHATPRKNGHSKQLQQQNNDDEGVKTTNIQVCIRVRPMLVGANNNNNNNNTNNHNDNNAEYKSNTKTPNRRLSRLTNISRKKKNNYTSLTEDHHNTDNANGTHTATTTTTTAWNVVSHDTVQQSKQTQRIKGRTNSYTLDQIYEMEANNAEIYQKSVQPLVMATLEGYHASVFAYGQTSTGKTYTMSGTKHSPGIVPLAVSDMFRAISMSNSDDTSADRNREYLMRVSYLEIYNEQVIDLLSDNNNNSTIRILEAKGEVAIRGLREEVVTSPNQIFALLQKGNARRQVGSTQMNQHSSRSHTIVRLCLESSVASNTNTKTRVSSLSLVDLAGSESVRLTGSTGDRRKEGQYINKSLMTLGQVIYKLSESQGDSTPNKHHSTTSTTQQHIPYRDSKLTRLLQPSLSGNAQITCICTISPDTKHLEESHNTLKFATRAKRIQQRSVQNEVDDQNSTLLQEYKMEIEELRQQLAELKSAYTTQEDVKELIQAIQKMEELILTADKLQKRELHPNGTFLELPTPESGDTLLLSPDFVENTPPPLSANQKTVNNNNTKFTFASPQSSSLSRSKRMNNNDNTKNNHPTTPLYQEMHRIQELLDTVLQKRGLGNRNKNQNQQQQPDDNDNEDDNLLNVTREEELVEELRHQLHQQEVTTSLKSADATFLQSQLLEKDGLLLEVSHILEAAEHRQLELETENATLKKLVEEKNRKLKYQEIKLISMGSPKSPVIQRL